MRTPETHSLHYADANEFEIAANEEILSRIEMMFEIDPLKDRERKVRVFIDAIVEGRKLQRLEKLGQIPDVADLNFPLRQLLKHVPIQEWPFPHSLHYSCSFYDTHGDRDAFESHLAENHPLVFQTEGYHSETQLALVRLLRIALKIKKQKRWKCPFGYRPSDFDTYSEVAGHVLNTDFHRHYERFFYSEVSGFWAPIIYFLNENRIWSTIKDMFLADKVEAEIELLPPRKEIADQRWKTSRHKYAAADIGHIRVLKGSPLKDILYFL
jgi:hypothetical protein